jgi:hypothetical protein
VCFTPRVKRLKLLAFGISKISQACQSRNYKICRTRFQINAEGFGSLKPKPSDKSAEKIIPGLA